MKNICFLAFLLLGIQSGFATKYFSKSTGDLDDPTTWGDASIGDGSGTSPVLADFTSGNVDTFVVANKGSFTHIKSWTLSSTKVVIIGNGVTSTNITIGGTNGAILGGAKIDVASNATLTFGRTTSGAVGTSFLNNLSSSSTVVYNSAASSSVLTNASYGNLTISSNSQLLGAITVFGALNIGTNRSLIVSSQTLDVKGTIAGSGSLTTTNLSIVNVGGAGTSNIGTIRFSGTTPVVNRLNISFISSSGMVTLGSNITVQDNGVAGTSYFNFDTGRLDLNGFILTVAANSDANFSFSSSSGVLSSSGNSQLRIFGTVGANGGNNQLFMNPSANILKSLLLSNGSAVMELGNALIITDSIAIHDGELTTNGNLVLTATSALKGRIGISSNSGGTAFLLGDVTVETFVPGTSTGWANLGSPVDGQTVASWDTYSSSGAANGIPMTCQGCAYDVTGIGSYFESIQGWKEIANTYDTTIQSSTSLLPGKGFWVYVGDALASTGSLKLVNSGPAVTGGTSVPLTATSGSSFNLIANPYASPISWNSTYALSGNSAVAYDAYYVWNADLNGGNGLLTSFAGGVSSPGGAGSAGNIIASGQGFFVEAKTAGSFTFAESIKSSANTSSNPLLRPSPANVGQVFRVKLEGSTGDWDATVFRMHAMATPAFDGDLDARKIFQSPGYAGYPGVYSKYTSISSKDGFGQDYSIMSFPETGKDVTIPLLAKVMSSGTYTITGLELENIPSCLILKDKLLNKTQDLQMGDYVFTINDTTSTPRFELLLCRGISAPTGISTSKVDENSVQISRADNGVLVTTNFEQNTKAKIEVFNLLGQSLWSSTEVNGKTNSTLVPIDTDNLVVLVKVSTETEVYTKKVLLR